MWLVTRSVDPACNVAGAIRSGRAVVYQTLLVAGSSVVQVMLVDVAVVPVFITSERVGGVVSGIEDDVNVASLDVAVLCAPSRDITR